MTRLVALLLALAVAAGAWGTSAAVAQTKKDAPKASTKSEGKAETKAEKKKELIDINSASAEELRTLPGIGEAYSKAIIGHRPYANKTQLVSRNVIPKATYEKIRDQIIAKQDTVKKK